MSEDILKKIINKKSERLISFKKKLPIESIKEHRPRQKTPYGQPMTKCEQTRYMIKKYGIDWATKNLAHPEHQIGTYQAPGEV